jgi:hypothetical protein
MNQTLAGLPCSADLFLDAYEIAVSINSGSRSKYACPSGAVVPSAQINSEIQAESNDTLSAPLSHTLACEPPNVICRILSNQF